MNKVMKLMEVISENTADESTAFDAFCSVLAKDYGWLTRELEADLLVEKGQFTIEEDLMRDAGMFVHRYALKSSTRHMNLSCTQYNNSPRQVITTYRALMPCVVTIAIN